jgi:hypothetical protein
MPRTSNVTPDAWDMITQKYRAQLPTIESPFPSVISQPIMASNSNRRRTTQTFAPFSSESLHSSPTIGKSGLTASYSSSNFSRLPVLNTRSSKRVSLGQTTGQVINAPKSQFRSSKRRLLSSGISEDTSRHSPPSRIPTPTFTSSQRRMTLSSTTARVINTKEVRINTKFASS